MPSPAIPAIAHEEETEVAALRRELDDLKRSLGRGRRRH
jgi:hypothetical protein